MVYSIPYKPEVTRWWLTDLSPFLSPPPPTHTYTYTHAHTQGKALILSYTDHLMDAMSINLGKSTHYIVKLMSIL